MGWSRYVKHPLSVILFVAFNILSAGPGVLCLVVLGRGVQKIFRRVLSDRSIKVYTGKDVVDVRDPPEGLEGVTGTGTLFCSDGTEVNPGFPFCAPITVVGRRYYLSSVVLR